MTSADNDPTPDDDGDDAAEVGHDHGAHDDGVQDLEQDADPFDALAEVLAGPDGDPERGRDAARRVLGPTNTPTPVEVPRTAPRPGPNPARDLDSDVDVVDWLHGVLDEEQRRADAATGDLEPFIWAGDHLGWVSESSRATARIQAERALLALHTAPHNCPGTRNPNPSPNPGSGCGSGRGIACPVVLHLAHGHRFDAEGWRPAWSPTS